MKLLALGQAAFYSSARRVSPLTVAENIKFAGRRILFGAVIFKWTEGVFDRFERDSANRKTEPELSALKDPAGTERLSDPCGSLGKTRVISNHNNVFMMTTEPKLMDFEAADFTSS